MLMPTSHRRAIYEQLFGDGVIVAEKNFIHKLKTHPTVKTPTEPVPNLHVIKTLMSLKSRGFVKEQFAWHHYYWWLTNEGIEFLRTELNLPAEIVPGTLKRQQRPPDARFQGPSPAGPGRGGPPGERAPRFGQGGDREGYRRRPESDKVAEAGPGAPSGGRPFVPRGFGRGRGGPPPASAQTPQAPPQ